MRDHPERFVESNTENSWPVIRVFKVHGLMNLLFKQSPMH